jgi:hypothetical protein
VFFFEWFAHDADVNVWRREDMILCCQKLFSSEHFSSFLGGVVRVSVRDGKVSPTKKLLMSSAELEHSSSCDVIGVLSCHIILNNARKQGVSWSHAVFVRGIERMTYNFSRYPANRSHSSQSDDAKGNKK